LFNLEASILESGQESDYQDHQGMRDNASITTNPNSRENAKTPPAACRVSGGSQTASSGHFFIFSCAKEFESLQLPEKPKKTFWHLSLRDF